jgi:hypothetical protein
MTEYEIGYYKAFERIKRMIDEIKKCDNKKLGQFSILNILNHAIDEEIRKIKKCPTSKI